MPAILTHYIAGQCVLKRLPLEIIKRIQPYEPLYNLGTQGPDIFFYYIRGAMRKPLQGIGSYMHQNDLGHFLVQLAREAKAASLLPFAEFVYAAGFIMHYLVDSYTHPYVYAKTEKSGASKIKNSTDHHEFETAIDIAMLQLYDGNKPADYELWHLINAEDMDYAAEATSRAICAVYGRQISAKDVENAMLCMVKIVRLIQSRRGWRKKILGLAEKLILGHPLNSSIIHGQSIDNSIDYLNEKKRPWQAPWENSARTDSFLDLFQAAVDEGVQLVQTLHGYIYEGLPIEALQEKLGNRSLKTGQECGTEPCEPS